MKSPMLKAPMLLMLLSVLCVSAPAQSRGGALLCRQTVSRLKPLPKLSYACRPEAPNDYDEAILAWPERRSAIRDFMQQLSAFNASVWWTASVDELNVCNLLGHAGRLDTEEREKFLRGDYPISLFGNSRVRLYLAADPCYQTGFNGSNAFLLVRQGGRVAVTQVLDGHFSRADNSVALDFAATRAGQVIEVATTTGGLNPYVTNYYFALDERTGKAAPRMLFEGEGGLTNKLTSALILDDGTLPPKYKEMRVIEGRSLARAFYAYEDSAGDEAADFTDASGRALRRITYRWNGRYYTKVKK